MPEVLLILFTQDGGLGPIQPSNIGFDPLDVSLWIGLIAPFLVSLLLKMDWSHEVKFWTTISVVVVLTIFAWWTTSYPASWELLATQFAVVFAASQTVYNALKPSGIFEFLEGVRYKPKHAHDD